MAGVCYDTVVDEHMRPVFNGTRDETVKWLTDSAPRFTETYQVCIGLTLQVMEIPDYLQYVERPKKKEN
jgi:hypothetical protein